MEREIKAILKSHDLYLMIKVSESTINTMFPGVPSHAIIYGKENRQTLFKFLNFRNTITNVLTENFAFE